MHKFASHTLIVLLLLSFPAGLFLVYAPDSPKSVAEPVKIEANLKETAEALDYKEREITALEQKIVEARSEVLQYEELRGNILNELMMLQAKVEGIIERTQDEERKIEAVNKVAAKAVEKRTQLPIDRPVQKPGVKSLGIKVGTPSMHVKGNVLDLSFDVHNTKKNQKVAGFVWASVEVRGENGETYHLSAPSQADVSPGGEIRNVKKAAIFGIQRYKRNSFRLEMPDGDRGKVLGVKIGVSDRQGNYLLVYDFPGD